MVAGWTLMALLLNAPATSTPAECARGSRTALERVFAADSAAPRHDQPLGRTTLRLRSAKDGRLQQTEQWEGQWGCLGKVPGARGYLLGGVLQRGAWLPLSSIVYLPEEGGPAEPSAFDRAGYLALARVPSPDGRFLAFIGGLGVADGLYVLDVVHDTVRKVGPAPAPPPDRTLRAICEDQPLEWGSCWADRLVELEPDVLRFVSAQVLEASYGRDGPAGRASERSRRRFPLGP